MSDSCGIPLPINGDASLPARMAKNRDNFGKFTGKPKQIFGCLECSNDFMAYVSDDRKYCSKRCLNKNLSNILKGKKKSFRTEAHKEKIRQSVLNQYRTGKKKPNFLGEKRLDMTGENNSRWIKDRTQLKDDSKERGGQLHREWSNSIKKRDGWKCRIADESCNGRIEAHHILGWSEYPELRYQINNGITLCHAHHPRKRAEEKLMVSYFMELLSASKE